MIERISGATDARVREYRDIADPELVRSRGLFVAEGRLVVRRLIEERRYTLRSLLVSEAVHRSLDTRLTELAERVPIYVCQAADFIGISVDASERFFG